MQNLMNMRNCILDCETIPADTATLEKLMPPEVSAPVMPDEIAKPFEPDFAEKCPKYASVKDETEREAKRQEWIEGKRRDFTAKAEAARDKWKMECAERRAKFIENAALDATTGHLKMIGLKTPGRTVIFLWEPRRAVATELTAIGKFPDTTVLAFMLEKQMLHAFAQVFYAAMGEQDARCITFYGNTFDLPFLARRQAILGSYTLMQFLRRKRRGRYLDPDTFVDLHELWTMGDRECHTGGLDGLCKTLGLPGKNGTGACFYKWYAENPEEGVAYLLGDLAATEQAAERMGELQ